MFNEKEPVYLKSNKNVQNIQKINISHGINRLKSNSPRVNLSELQRLKTKNIIKNNIQKNCVSSPLGGSPKPNLNQLGILKKKTLHKNKSQDLNVDYLT